MIQKKTSLCIKIDFVLKTEENMTAAFDTFYMA